MAFAFPFFAGALGEAAVATVLAAAAGTATVAVFETVVDAARNNSTSSGRDTASNTEPSGDGPSSNTRDDPGSSIAPNDANGGKAQSEPVPGPMESHGTPTTLGPDNFVPNDSCWNYDAANSRNESPVYRTVSDDGWESGDVEVTAVSGTGAMPPHDDESGSEEDQNKGEDRVPRDDFIWLEKEVFKDTGGANPNTSTSHVRDIFRSKGPEIFKKIKSVAKSGKQEGKAWGDPDYRIDIGHAKDGVLNWHLQVNKQTQNVQALSLRKAAGRDGHGKLAYGRFDGHSTVTYKEWASEVERLVRERALR